MAIDIDTKYNVRPFEEGPVLKETPENILHLDSIDLSLYIEGPEGYESRKLLARQLEPSISTHGFFNVINFGIKDSDIERLKAIAQSVLELDEKSKVFYYSGAATVEEDLKNKFKGLGAERDEGYKPKGFWKLHQEVRDLIVHFNFRDAKLKNVLTEKCSQGLYPELFRHHATKEIHEYYSYLHNEVLRKILNLCDIILELEEGTLFNKCFPIRHKVENSAGGHGRFMMYYPTENPEYEKKTNGIWLRGHADISAFSIITSQPILSLQIREFKTGEWKYINYNRNSLIFNVGDALEFLTGGFFKASVHRVVLPPYSQRSFKRLVLIDFVNPLNETVIHPQFLNSPKLKKMGLHQRPDWDLITFQDWDREKGKLLGVDTVNDRSEIEVYGRKIERWHP